MKNLHENPINNNQEESSEVGLTPEEKLRLAQERLREAEEKLRRAKERQALEREAKDKAINDRFAPLIEAAERKQRYYEKLAEELRRIGEKYNRGKK